MSNVNAQRFGRIGIDELTSETFKLEYIYVSISAEDKQKQTKKNQVDNDDVDGEDDSQPAEWNDIRMNWKMFMAIGKQLDHFTTQTHTHMLTMNVLSFFFNRMKSMSCQRMCGEMNLMSKLYKYKVYATNQLDGSVNSDIVSMRVRQQKKTRTRKKIE